MKSILMIVALFLIVAILTAVISGVIYYIVAIRKGSSANNNAP